MSRREGAGWELKTEQQDVVVRLLHPNDLSCLLALPLHSLVLASRSEFFAVRLSRRWDAKPVINSGIHINSSDINHVSSSNADITTAGKHDNNNDKQDAIIDIAMLDPSAATTYKKCLELMYVPRKFMYSCRPFSTVKDAISMLYVAAELLFHDCIDHCMQFLEMLPSWTAEEESSIRSTVSSLQLAHINADLAARLSLSECIPSQQPICTMRRMLVHVLEMACERLPTSPPALRNIDTSKPIPEATVLLVWNANLDIIKARLNEKHLYSLKIVVDVSMASSGLSWLLGKLLALEAADAVVRAFVEDTKLSNLMQDLMKRKEKDTVRPLINAVLSLLDQIMPLVFGKVLLSQAARMTLVTTWLPVAQGLSNSDGTLYPNLLDSFPKLISSLPVLDREQIYKNFLKLNERSVLTVDASFEPWCEMLRQLHLEHGDRQEGLLAIDQDV